MNLFWGTVSSIHIISGSSFYILLLFLVVYLVPIIFLNPMGQSPIFVIKDVLAYLIQLSFLLGTISGVLLAIKIRLSPESADFYFFSIKMMLLIASAFVSLPYLRLQEAGRTQHLINVQAKVEISFHDLRKLFLLISFLVIFTASLLRRVQ